MYNFYQSKIRKNIQKIYWNDTFEIRLRGNSYQWIIKKKVFFWKEFKWLQVLWVLLPDEDAKIKDGIRHIKKFCRHQKWVIFFQLGFINILTVIQDPQNITLQKENNIRTTRQQLNKWLGKFGFKPTFRENMPPATIIMRTDLTEEEMWNKMSSQAQRYIKKAQKRWVICETLNLKDEIQLDIFWNKWKNISQIKGFNTITYQQYKNLINYLEETKTWKLRVAKFDNQIIAWWIYIYDNFKKRVVYLYWFSDRSPSYKNLGAHYLLKFEIWKEAKSLWYKSFDLFGASPTWNEKHSLFAVSKFKESLWWDKIEYYGSFDIVKNFLLYNLFRFKRKYLKW